MNRALFLVGLFAGAALSDALADALPANTATSVDEIFSAWNASTPGCAVGVAVGGKPVLTRAYGMADLERDVRNTPETIFEAGSVAKQFTAMAVLLLAEDGKLSLDDPVRKHIPELPEYPVQPTIRHMLHHTSGLRDWGGVQALAGAPRTTHEYTQAHVIEILARQKELNFTPGSLYSYTNSGYNLAAIIVARLSGMSFAEFSKQRIFTPLGMTRSSWRDDHRRIVKDRALAYEHREGTYRTLMPFENAHGNGGLLTTAGDLLKWNENFVTVKVGKAETLKMMGVPGTLTDGRVHDYGLGLVQVDYHGEQNLAHAGATAGYTAHLNRFPAAHLSVAVLCNTANANATRYANRVSDIFLGDRIKKLPAPDRRAQTSPDFTAPTSAELEALTGSYWSGEAETRFTAAMRDGKLVLRRRPDSVIDLTPAGQDRFRSSIGQVIFVRDVSGKVEGFSVKQDRVWDLRFVREK